MGAPYTIEFDLRLQDAMDATRLFTTYLPNRSFNSPAARAEIVAFARAQLVASRSNPGGAG